MVNLVDKLIFKPQILNTSNCNLIKDFEKILKNYYNIGKSFDSKEISLKTLTVKRCDDEQIWRQLNSNANLFLKKRIVHKCYSKMKQIIGTEQENGSLKFLQKSKNILDKKKILVVKKKENLIKKLSTFEQKQQLINERINKLEKQSLVGQTWQLAGEVDAKTMPHNGLISQKLIFESCHKFKPKIILENIEKIIKKRIIEKKFDDVIIKKTLRKKKQKQKEVDDKKSKHCLEELYREVKTHDTKQPVMRTHRDKKRLDEHKDILRLKSELFHQLDSITNFYLTRPLIRKERDETIEFIQQKV